MTLDLTPEIQERLSAQAQNSGLSLKSFAEQVLAERSRLASSGNPAASASELSAEERLREFNAWVTSHAGNTIVLPDEAMERESIYIDRDF